MTAKLTLKNAPEGSETAQLHISDFAQVLEALAQDNVSAMTLSSVMLTPERMQELAQALPECKNLEKISFQGLGRCKELGELHSALVQVPNLREVSAPNNTLGSESAAEIAKLIAHHPRLESLYIKYNVLLLQGTQAIAPCIAHNGGLRELDISFNAMDSPGVDLMATALETNKGLVKINLDTTYPIKTSTPNIERMLQTNKNLIECTGLTSDIIKERLAHNHAEGQKLAEALATDPEALTEEEYAGLGERMALTTYLLKTEKGMSYEEVNETLAKALIAGEKQEIDIFPSMVAVLPFDEMLELSANRGKPLTANDFFGEKGGATPLLYAAIERGVAPQIFNLTMGWKTAAQLRGAYRKLPTDQRDQVTHLNQMCADLPNRNQGLGRRMLG